MSACVLGDKSVLSLGWKWPLATINPTGNGCCAGRAHGEVLASSKCHFFFFLDLESNPGAVGDAMPLDMEDSQGGAAP